MKLLVISQFFPYPPYNGGRMRAYQLIRGLAKEHVVDLIAFSGSESDLDHVDVLQAFCRQTHVVRERPTAGPLRESLALLSPAPRSYTASWNPEVKALVDRLVSRENYDAALAFGLRNGLYLRSRRGTATIIDNDNCDTEFMAGLVARESSSFSRFRRRLTWAKSRLYESRLAPRFDAATVVSEDDANALARIAPALASRKAVHIVPNGTDLALLDYRGPEADASRIVFTGALTYSANFDAAGYFMREVFPLVKSQIPEAHLVITGSTEGADISLFQRPDVTLTGFVEDIRPEIAGSALVVVPTRVGGGTRLKILEAMALGTPVVSTSFGAMGLGAKDGYNVLISDTPGGFAEEVCRLMRDPGLRAEIASNAREFVRERYGWDSIVESLNRVIATAVESVRSAEECDTAQAER